MNDKPETGSSVLYIVYGACIGCAVGAALQNVGLGVALGAAAGAVFMAFGFLKKR